MPNPPKWFVHMALTMGWAGGALVAMAGQEWGVYAMLPFMVIQAWLVIP